MGRSFSSPSASRTANSSRRGSRARRNRLVIYPHHDMGVGSADTFVGCMLLLGSFLSSLDYMRITWFTCCGRWASCYIFSLSLLNTLVYTCIYTYSLEKLCATINSKLTPKIGFKKKRIWYQYTLPEESAFPWPAAGVACCRCNVRFRNTLQKTNDTHHSQPRFPKTNIPKVLSNARGVAHHWFLLLPLLRDTRDSGLNNDSLG